MHDYIQPQYPQSGGGFAAYCAATYCVLRVLRYCVMRHSIGAMSSTVEALHSSTEYMRMHFTKCKCCSMQCWCNNSWITVHPLFAPSQACVQRHNPAVLLKCLLCSITLHTYPFDSKTLWQCRSEIHVLQRNARLHICKHTADGCLRNVEFDKACDLSPKHDRLLRKFSNIFSV